MLAKNTAKAHTPGNQSRICTWLRGKASRIECPLTRRRPRALLPVMDLAKLMKQAEKMQQDMEAAQADLRETVLEASAAGGAVKAMANGQAEITGLTIAPEFLQEDAATVEATVLAAVQDVLAQAKALQAEKMGSVTQGMGGLPGLS